MSTGTLVIGFLLGLFGFFIFLAYKKMKMLPAVEDHQNVLILTEQNFEQQIQKGIILVDFWAAWCMPCRMMPPILNELAITFNDKICIGKINVEEFQNIAVKYSVRSIPTLILFQNGLEIKRFVGVKSKDFYAKEIMKVIDNG